MSGRPSSITPFASQETTYPAGGQAWASTPIRVQPVLDYITPLAGFMGQYMNYELGVLGDAVAGILNYIGNMPASNFPYRYSSLSDIRAIGFDPTGGRWLLAREGTGTEVWFTRDSGTAAQIGSGTIGGDTSYQPIAIAGYDSTTYNQNNTFGAFCVAYASPTLTTANTKMSIWDISTLTYHDTFNVSDSAHTCAISAIAAFNGKFYAFGGGGSTSHNFVGTGSLVSGGGSASGGVISSNPLGTSVSPNKWLAAKNGATETILLGIPSTAATNTYLSVNTSNAVTVQTGGWSVGEIVTGLAWSDTDQIFMVTTSSALPGAVGPTPTTKVYTSTNGIAWTLVATLGSSPLTVSSLTAMGSLWIALHEDLTNGDTTMYSTNKGLTWFAPYIAPLSPWVGSALSTNTPPVYSTILANSDKSQLLASNRNGIMGSINVGTAGAVVT